MVSRISTYANFSIICSEGNKSEIKISRIGGEALFHQDAEMHKDIHTTITL